MKPHKHAELIKAWADGAVVEWKCSQGGTWHQLKDIMSLVKYDSVEYRIKPEPKPDVERYCQVGELKDAEVLK